MAQLTVVVPQDLASRVDDLARRLRRSRAQVVREALVRYLEDFEDLRLGLQNLDDPADPLLDWPDVRRQLLPRP